MKKIDFTMRKELLHEEMLTSIEDLFEKARVEEIEILTEDGGWQRTCYVSVCRDGVDSIEEVLVKKCKCVDGEIFIQPRGDDEWILCSLYSDVITCSLDDLYEAIYDIIADINRDYYVCDTDLSGNPTGNIKKVTWRIEYAEQMIITGTYENQKSNIFEYIESAKRFLVQKQP